MNPLFSRCRGWIVRMRCPIRVITIDNLASARINSAGLLFDHGDAVFNGADFNTQVTRHAFGIYDAKLAIRRHRNRLMRCIFARSIAASATDTVILVDRRFGDVIQIKMLPVNDIGNGRPYKVINRFMALFVHPL